MFLKVYRVDGVIVISKQDVNMTLLVVRMVVLLIGRSTSLGSTVWLNSPVVEENLWFISRVLHSPPPQHPHPQPTSLLLQVEGSSSGPMQYVTIAMNYNGIGGVVQ